ncbi:MAG: CaiB/BaiF CoA-transferase family protein [Bacteroidota bacterium]
MQSAFFKDLVIIELASVLAGPAVGMFFAELGARVIKIENKASGGDMTRLWKVKGEDANKEDSAYYRSVNWGKEVLFLDLKAKTDLDQLYDLIKEADVVINNFKPKSAQKLGVAYEQLKELNLQLIFAQLTAFGEQSDRLGFDVVLQAEAGFLYMNGERNGAAVKMPVALIDLLAAHQLKEGILLSLLHRCKHGKGSYIHVSLLEAALASLANQATNWLIAQYIPQKMGMEHPNIAPYGDVFFTEDEKAIVLAVGTDKQFKALCDLLDISRLTVDTRFQTNDARVQNRAALKALLKPIFKQYQFQPLIEQIHQKGIPAGQIRNMQEVFEQPLAQEMILKHTDGTSCVKSVAFDIKFD